MSAIEAYHRMYSVTKEAEELQETTVPAYMHPDVESWEHHSKVSPQTKEKINDVFGGKQFTHFPLDDLSLPDPEVHDHLIKHGYRIEDYKAGTASKTVQVGAPERGIPLRTKQVVKRIGAIIDETKAPPHVKKAFDNDPVRTSAKQTDMHVVISTSPLALAGMTTGTHWHEDSCMDLVDGSNKHYVQRDSEHGSHVAYLVHRDDKSAFEHGEPSNPIARVLIKPFHNLSDSSDTIFRPETKMYGSGNTAFLSTVTDWAREKYPAKEGDTYEKENRLYDDDSNTEHTELSDKQLKDHLNGLTSMNTSYINVPRHKLDRVMDGINRGEHTGINRIARIGNLTSHDVKAIANKFPEHLETIATHHGNKFSEHMIDNLVDTLKGKAKQNSTSLSNSIPANVLMNPKLPSHVVDLVHPSRYTFIRRNKLKPEHLTKAIDELSEKGIAATIHLASTHHLAKLVDVGIMSPSRAAEHPKFTQQLHDKFIGDGKASHLRTSPYSSVDDIRSPVDIISLGRNSKIDHSTPVLKELMMAHIKNHTKEADGTTLNGVFGYISNNIVPANISKHMTDDDFEHFAAKNVSTGFENSNDNDRYVNHIVKRAVETGDKDRVNHAVLDTMQHVDEHGIDRFSPSGPTIYNHMQSLTPHVDKMGYTVKREHKHMLEFLKPVAPK